MLRIEGGGIIPSAAPSSIAAGKDRERDSDWRGKTKLGLGIASEEDESTSSGYRDGDGEGEVDEEDMRGLLGEFDHRMNVLRKIVAAGEEGRGFTTFPAAATGAGDRTGDGQGDKEVRKPEMEEG